LLAHLLELLEEGELNQINRGIEREALRVDANGMLSQARHPEFLGSKLCHPSITTDFSEAQLELITSVERDLDKTLTALDDVHRFVYQGLSDELLWCTSMPCDLPADSDIPLANYGPSNLGKLKTTYRNGLGLRYGRSMQTICAVHYNFSFSDRFWESIFSNSGKGEDFKTFKSRRYFDMMRNFRRYSWLPIYLFGASPVVAKSFVSGREHGLSNLGEADLYAPMATSLRNGDLGYQSNTQSDSIHICYNSLENYVSTLAAAVITPHPEYNRISGSTPDAILQVNGNILQSEAEFYTTIRAKCVPPSGTNFLEQLGSKGVEYVEVRLLDANPYAPLGIDESQIRFLDTLLLYCLLVESPGHDESLCQAVRTNAHRTVYEGRDPHLTLDDDGSTRSLGEWGQTLLDEMIPVAETLDKANGITDHIASLHAQNVKVRDPLQTPSARLIFDMQESGLSFFEFAMEKSREHREYFLSRPLTQAQIDHFQQLSKQSVDDQQQLESADKVPFNAYLEHFMGGYFNLDINA
jgi:glutamate--cysteine ligase